MNEIVAVFLQAVNEILAAGIVVIAASLLLYNLTRNLSNRVARSSGIVLACVTWAFISDVFISLGPGSFFVEAALRLQWIGIAVVPAATFHLSDALLATTGLPSRGRRRRISRLLYAIGIAFAFAAVLTDLVIITVSDTSGISLEGQSLLPLFMLFFIGTNVTAFINVNRARQRCLTRSTKRRMAYLQVTILTPALGIFPYSLVLSPGIEFSIQGLLLINIVNIGVILMLIFLSYPLSFFGSNRPDRVVKVELLRFLLHGPGTGLLALAVIIFTTRGIRILGLPGEDFMPFAVVAIVLLWQWMIALGLPRLERWLVYGGEDDEQLAKLQDLSDRLLTRNDLLQLIEATLETICDTLRVEVAFIAVYSDEGMEIIQSVGMTQPEQIQEIRSAEDVGAIVSHFSSFDERYPESVEWKQYQLLPLYSRRYTNGNSDHLRVIAILGIQSERDTLPLVAEDHETLERLLQRIEQSLDDMQLQTEIYAALEGLLPQISITRSRADELEYRPGRTQVLVPNLPSNEEVYELVRAALRHYWGGPGMTHSRLLNFKSVQETVRESDSPVQGLRQVLHQLVEAQRPAQGERNMISPEWVIYNILTLRFIEGRKVRDVAKRMNMSEGDFYRKQRRAIEAVAESLLDQEVKVLTEEIASESAYQNA